MLTMNFSRNSVYNSLPSKSRNTQHYREEQAEETSHTFNMSDKHDIQGPSGSIVTNGNNNDIIQCYDAHPQTDNEAQLKARRLVYFCGLIASLISILLGYDVGIMAEAIIYIDKTMPLSTIQGNVVIGCLNMVAAFGGFMAGKSSDALGRKRAIVFACVVFCIGAVLMTISQDFGLLLFGRIITGFGVGSGFVVGPVYIAEVTPKDIRGMMVAFSDVSINFGILLGFGVGIACKDTITSDDAKWRVMLGIGMVPPVLIILFLRYVPESPRWLQYNGRMEEAKEVLLMITGSEEQANEEFTMIQHGIEDEASVTTSWKEVLWPTHRHIMIPVALSLALGFVQQITGTEALIYYSPEILDKAGYPEASSMNDNFIVVIGFCKLIGEACTMFVVDHYGRKPFLYTSAVGLTTFMLLISLAFHFRDKVAVVLGICGAMLFFSIGIAPLTFVIASELNPLPIRGKAVALTTFVNRFTSGLVALLFNTLVTAFGSLSAYFLFYTVMSFCTIFFCFYIPETAGQSLEEIGEMFGGVSTKNRHSSRSASNEVQSALHPVEDDGKL
jgi:sugar porter (SP) family MFS transporter